MTSTYFQSTNPFNKEIVGSYKQHSPSEITFKISQSNTAWQQWRTISFADRCLPFQKLVALLRSRKMDLSALITKEMGKRIVEAEAEIEKCAVMIEYYMQHGQEMLMDEEAPSDASRSYIRYESLGPILGVMPWNFPFWQVLRFAVPTLLAGNSVLLKHASNVQGCALEIERLFRDADFPVDVFQTLVVPSSSVKSILENDYVQGVSLTGSEHAGRSVGKLAGENLKKCILELGGSDPFLVFEDADIDEAVRTGVISRMLTSGQTCISAKRFLVHLSIYPIFLKKLREHLTLYIPNDPLLTDTTLAPLAKEEFVLDLQTQVKKSMNMGAQLEFGDNRANGCFYSPVVVTGVTEDMPVFQEETFGPCFAICCFSSDQEAIDLANQSSFGLGASVWTKDEARQLRCIRNIKVGAVFVNGLVKSDPRLPFGGILNSGFGRELGIYGIRAFTNEKTVWIR